MEDELKKLKDHIKKLEEVVLEKDKALEDRACSEEILLELLREKNQKQSEVDELLVKLKDKDEEVCNYVKMYKDYKEAAEDRWERLQFYEKNKIVRALCSANVKMEKKKEVTKNKKDIVRERYYALYSEQEKERFLWCKNIVDSLEYKPLLSMVVPVYNTELELLYELIFSMKEQIYGNWEICFANGSFENKELIKALNQYAEEDSRIKFKNLEKNGGISYNTNEAFNMVTGEFIGMLDHDDLLSPNALFEVVYVLNENKELDFIYSDQDKVDEPTTGRFGTLHKPSWSMETLYSGNYITHFSVVRRSIIDKIGGWDSTLDGAQDWDLFLKIAEATKKIYAIPQMLYHWRTATTSTAFSMDTKDYAKDAQILSLQNHLDRLKYPAKAHFSKREKLEIHIDWKYDTDIKISIIIWDQGINDNLNSYIKFMKMELKNRLMDIVLISDDSERLNSVIQKCIKVEQEFSNYAQAYNYGVSLVKGEVLVFTTDRAVAANIHTYDELADWALHPEIGVVGPKVVYGNRNVNSMGIILNKDHPRSLFHKYGNFGEKATEFGNVSWYRNVSAVDYFCFAVEKKKYIEIGEFDETKGDLAIIDFCLRKRKKFRNMVNPFAVVQYNHNYPKEIMETSYEKYLEILKEYEMPEIDQYYNPEFYEIEKQIKKRVITWK